MWLHYWTISAEGRFNRLSILYFRKKGIRIKNATCSIVCDAYVSFLKKISKINQPTPTQPVGNSLYGYSMYRPWISCALCHRNVIASTQALSENPMFCTNKKFSKIMRKTYNKYHKATRSLTTNIHVLAVPLHVSSHFSVAVYKF
jgi:hypothetical protein